MPLPSGSTWRFSNLPEKNSVVRHNVNLRETANIEIDGNHIFVTSLSPDGRASHTTIPVSTMIRLLTVAGKIR